MWTVDGGQGGMAVVLEAGLFRRSPGLVEGWCWSRLSLDSLSCLPLGKVVVFFAIILACRTCVLGSGVMVVVVVVTVAVSQLPTGSIDSMKVD